MRMEEVRAWLIKSFSRGSSGEGEERGVSAHDNNLHDACCRVCNGANFYSPPSSSGAVEKVRTICHPNGCCFNSSGRPYYPQPYWCTGERPQHRGYYRPSSYSDPDDPNPVGIMTILIRLYSMRLCD
jgi:hypothetical protein